MMSRLAAAAAVDVVAVQIEMLVVHIPDPVAVVAAAVHEIVEHNMGHIPTVDLLLADLDAAVVVVVVVAAAADDDMVAVADTD